MRFDRELTLCFFRPLRVFDKNRVPVLMYHSVSDDVEENVSSYYRVVTSPQRFAEQMQWLNELGYAGVSLEETLAAQSDGRNGERRVVAITFDDGFRDFYTAAWPVLQRHKFKATMYLPTAFISAQRKVFLKRECLTWDEVRELRKQGVRFGSHTVNHPKLYGLPWTEIESELAQSKSQIEQELGENISSFAYPFAFPQEDRNFVNRFTGSLRACSYQSCVTTVIGSMRSGDDPFRLKRLPANSCDDKALFAAKLEGAYDWIAGPQAFVRWAKARTGRTKLRTD